MKKTIFVFILATIVAAGMTSLKAANSSPDPCNAAGCPGSGATCCTDANGNIFYKGR